MPDDDKQITWEAPEFDFVEKEPFWYLTGGIIGLVLLSVAIYQRNLLFAVFLIIAAILVFSWSKQKPKVLSFLVNRNGVKIDEYKFFLYGELMSFSLIREIGEVGFDELILRQESRVNPYIKIKVPEAKTEELRQLLTSYLPEEEYGESLTDAIARAIRF